MLEQPQYFLPLLINSFCYSDLLHWLYFCHLNGFNGNYPILYSLDWTPTFGGFGLSLESVCQSQILVLCCVLILETLLVLIKFRDGPLNLSIGRLRVLFSPNEAIFL